MDFVYHDKLQPGEKTVQTPGLVDKQALDRFRSDLQDTARIFNQVDLLVQRNITMPAVNRDSALFAKWFQATELIVDQSFERANVQHLNAANWIVRNQA